MEQVEIEATAQRVAVWALPYVLFGRYLAIAEEEGAPFNRFLQDARLSSPQVTAMGANVDTLYGHVWFDLRDGPLLLRKPAGEDRYCSVQIVDAFQATLGYVGTRTSGIEAAETVIAGPEWTGTAPAGAAVLRVPTNMALGVARTRVDGPPDEEAALEAHMQFLLGRLEDGPRGLQPPIIEGDPTSRFPFIDFRYAGSAFFDELEELLVRIPPPPEESRYAEDLAALRAVDDPSMSPVLADAVRRAVEEVAALSGSRRTASGSWNWADFAWRDIPETDPLERAAINWQGPALHVADEAILVGAATASDGSPLSGSGAFRIDFPPGGEPPVNAFWSLTLYSMPDMFLVDNEIDRYSIGSATHDLVRAADGSMSVLIQHERPEDEQVNWLPAPAGPFMLLGRMYRPEVELIERRYALPPIVRVGS